MPGHEELDMRFIVLGYLASLFIGCASSNSNSDTGHSLDPFSSDGPNRKRDSPTQIMRNTFNSFRL